MTEMEDRVKRIVDGMPPLTDEQVARLVVLLRAEPVPAVPAPVVRDPEAEAKARADLAECRASDYIRNLLDGKQLTPEGIARLSVLLAPEPL